MTGGRLAVVCRTPADAEAIVASAFVAEGWSRLTILGIPASAGLVSNFAPLTGLVTAGEIAAEAGDRASKAVREAARAVSASAPVIHRVHTGWGSQTFLDELRRGEHDVLMVSAGPRSPHSAFRLRRAARQGATRIVRFDLHNERERDRKWTVLARSPIDVPSSSRSTLTRLSRS